MKKILFHKDVLFATIFVFLVIFILTSTIGTNIFEPGKHDFEDFDYTDIAYSRKVNANAAIDKSVVIINSGDTDRAGIAAIIGKVNSMKPKVVGIDMLFKIAKNPIADIQLAAAIAENNNIVLASDISMERETEFGFFKPWASHSGFANFFGEKNSVCRYFLPFHRTDSCFVASIVNIFDRDRFDQLKKRNIREEIINYSHLSSEYLVFDYHKLLNDKIDASALKGKIVLIGLCNNDENNVEDKHYTPLNEKMNGRSLPDMPGIIVNANIISMILDGSYINTSPAWLNLIISIMIAWLSVALIIHNINKQHIWFHIVIRLWQTAVVAILSLTDIFVLKYMHFKLDLRYEILLIVLSVEIIYLYEILIHWLQKRFGYKSIFKHH